MTESSTESHSLPRQFFEELKRSRVIRVVTLYIIVLWPIIQIADILTPAIGLPATAMRYMLIFFVAGLPVALILGWLYDLNRGGIVRTGDSAERLGHPLIGRSAEINIFLTCGHFVVDMQIYDKFGILYRNFEKSMCKRGNI